MSTISISANGKGTDFYLRGFYGQMGNYRKSANRSGEEPGALTQADTQALKKALRAIENTDEEDDTEDTAVEVSALLQTYNNLLDATDDMDDATVKGLRKKMQSLVKSVSSDLEDIGITVSSSGELKVKGDVLKAASHEDVIKVFGKTGSFGEKMNVYQKKLNNAASDYITQKNNQKSHQKTSAAQSIDIVVGASDSEGVAAEVADIVAESVGAINITV